MRLEAGGQNPLRAGLFTSSLALFKPESLASANAFRYRRGPKNQPKSSVAALFQKAAPCNGQA